jgi:formylglycine-generating enzyme required for sulfatase activity
VTARRHPGLSSTVPQRSESFDLLVQKASGGRGKRYQVRLLRSPAGESASDTKHTFGAKDLKALLGSAEVWRDVGSKGSARKGPEEIGAELFRALISGDIRRQWDKSLSIVREQGSRLRLYLRLGAVPELESWPWELLHDRTFLALSKETSVVRYLENPTGRGPRKLALPLKILVVVANPAECEPIDGEGEWDRLNRALKPLLDGDKVRISRLSPPTLPALEKMMRQGWHIVHFAGHGRFQDGEGSLILEDGAGGQQEISGKRLKVLLEGQEGLRLVVLNSCVGAKTSPENVFAGVAQSLVKIGVPAVAAMRSRISDRAALVFAASFYEALVREFPVDVALGEARRAMHAGHPENDDLEWSTPVLYMRSETEVVPQKHPWRARLAAVLSLATLAGGIYWFSTQPDKSSAPACPSPADLDMPFVEIKPDRFSMGGKGRQVEITKSYCLGKFEVTQGEWKKIMGPPPRQAKEGNDLPVGNVSWIEAETFLSRLAAKEPAAHYRLPTNAQWEFAARAGTSSKFSFGDDQKELPKYGNCHKAGEPVRVGSLQPNRWGLYDMYGNVSEWVEDWDEPLPEEPARDPIGPAKGTEKIRRGGSFNYLVRCNSTFQSPTSPERRSQDTGFRIVRDPSRQ